jgi:hypothetical protein
MIVIVTNAQLIVNKYNNALLAVVLNSALHFLLINTQCNETERMHTLAATCIICSLMFNDST